jgi:hypothetical protein
MNTEWGHVARRFERFIAGLTPSDADFEAAEANAAAVAGALRAAFRPLDTLLAGGFPGAGDSDYVLTGGVGKRTAVNPLTAVDMLYVLPTALRHRARPGIEAGPEHAFALMDEIKAAIVARFPGSEIKDGAWLVVRFDHGPDVRLLPVFPFGGAAETAATSGYLVGRPFNSDDDDEAAPGESWRLTNPAAERGLLAEADRISGEKATHLIRMLKAWRRTHGLPIPSIALDVLVTEFVHIWNYQRRSHLFYDWMIRDCFFWLCYQGGRRLRLPGTGERLALGEQWLASADRMYALAREACRLERDNQDAAAVACWRDIFGADYARSPADAGTADTDWSGRGNVVRMPSAS